MDELHAAIAAHLRAQRQRRVCALEERMLAIWHDQWAVPRCKVGGAAIDDDDGGLYSLADMRQFRECALHHTPF